MARGIHELEQDFRRNPLDDNVFSALVDACSAEGSPARLADVYERRAGHMEPDDGALDLLTRAAQVHRDAGNRAAEIRVLRKVLDTWPDNAASNERLEALVRDDQRWPDLVRLLESDIERAVNEGVEGEPLARLEMELATVWEEELFRLDKALAHYGRAVRADPSNIMGLEACRRILRALGQWHQVVELFRQELELCRDPRRKADLLVDLGLLQWKALSDWTQAARSLSDAANLRPGDESIQEALGELYASSGGALPDAMYTAAGIFLKIANRREAQGDVDAAVSFLRRALGSDSANEPAFIRLEQAYQEHGRWEDLEKLYRQRLGVAGEKEAAALQVQRGDILEQRLHRRSEARSAYEAALFLEGPSGDAASRLLAMCQAENDHQKTAELLQAQLDATEDQDARVQLLLQLAGLYRDRLDDMEAAAHLLHQALQAQPTNALAQEAYQDYFRRKKDYRNLAELLRFYSQSALETGDNTSEACRLLEELAEICERRLGDLDGAVEAWQQIAQVHPDTQRSRDNLGRLAQRMQRWKQMVRALEQELNQAVTPAQRLQALRRMAKAYYEWQVDPERTMQVLQEILRQSPQDEHALRMQVDICERESDFHGLAAALKAQLDGIMTKQERLAILRRLGDIQATKLKDPTAALRAYQILLDLSPNDKKVRRRVTDLLEEVEDHPRLARLLEQEAAHSRSLVDRLNAIRRLARLLDEKLEDPGRAAHFWQQLLELDPRDSEALDALAELHQRAGRYAELMASLRLALRALDPASPAAARADLLLRIAELAEEKLGNPAEAVAALEERASVLPADRTTLESLSRLYVSLGKYRELVDVLAQQIDNSDETERQVMLAFRQGDILEEKLDDPEAAARVFEQIIHQLSPADLDAHRRLRQIHQRLGQVARACEVAEREMLLLSDDEDRLALALEIARMWREAGDVKHAVAAFERVLKLDPDSVEALGALRVLYLEAGLFNAFATTAQTIFATLDDADQRLELLMEVGQVYEERLLDARTAFQWFQRAHDLFPAVEEPGRELRRLAREYGLWEDLTVVLMQRRDEADPRQYVELTVEVARVCEEQLGDPATAFAELEQALPMDPGGQTLLPHLTRLAGEAGLFARLYQLYGELGDGEPDPHSPGRAADPADGAGRGEARRRGGCPRRCGGPDEAAARRRVPPVPGGAVRGRGRPLGPVPPGARRPPRPGGRPRRAADPAAPDRLAARRAAAAADGRVPNAPAGVFRQPGRPHHRAAPVASGADGGGPAQRPVRDGGLPQPVHGRVARAGDP